MAADLEKEAKVLEQAIEKGRLQLRWQGIVEAARQSARAQRDREGEEMARGFEGSREVARELGIGVVGGAVRNGEGGVVVA